ILDRIDYDASGGKEIFLQFVSEDKNKLFALLRLRIPYNNLEIETTKEINKLYKLLPALENSAIIREVHTYGKLAQINQHDKSSPQHIGLGKKLIQEAEKIARNEFGAKKIAIISGIGVRGYYRKKNYRLQNTYMVKNLK
ncbi:MAG: GNAT family N-acetyltransferase, partial [Candidatus Moranbacteria bacterium]|nr:GNAT family N-acetyltransferase [Candidatus Moranbacteria bacterium]